jgi:hypothetical protein
MTMARVAFAHVAMVSARSSATAAVIFAVATMAAIRIALSVTAKAKSAKTNIKPISTWKPNTRASVLKFGPNWRLNAMTNHSDDIHRCPICAEPFEPADICATDITEGTCHFQCLEGSPVVDLETGEVLPDGVVRSFRFDEREGE